MDRRLFNRRSYTLWCFKTRIKINKGDYYDRNKLKKTIIIKNGQRKAIIIKNEQRK